MKLNNFKLKTTKINKEFDPVSYWYKLLLIIIIIFLVVISYSVYSFFYIKNQISLIEIESFQNINNSTSTESIQRNKENSQFMKDINNLNKTLEKYDQREAEYKRLMSIRVNTASSSVATSTE